LVPTRRQRDGAYRFDFGPSDPHKQPSVTALGVEGQLEGNHVHRVIPDDVETDSNTVTKELRNKLDDRVREFAHIASYGERRINFLGTYHHEESVYLNLMDRGYPFYVYPLVYPKPTEHIRALAPIIRRRLDDNTNAPDQIVADYRITPDYVADARKEGRRAFAMQQQLISDLGDEDRYPLKLADLIVAPFSLNNGLVPPRIVWGTNNGQGASTCLQDIQHRGFQNDRFHGPVMFSPQSEWIPYAGTNMWIDPAGKGKDKTAYAIVAYANGYLWVLAVGSFDGGYDDTTLNRLARAARDHAVHDIYIEDFALQGMFAQLFEPVLKRHFINRADNNPDFPQGWSASVQMNRPPPGFKEQRIISALEPVMNQHRLVVARSVAENTDLQYQLTRMIEQRDALEHEDEADALANCVRTWEENLNLDPIEGEKKEQEKKIQQELEALKSYERNGLINRNPGVAAVLYGKQRHSPRVRRTSRIRY
jgi:hypothetical protein